MLVADIIRAKGRDFITIRMNETVEAAAKLLHRQRIGAVVVKDVCGTEGEAVVGIFSERDIVRAVAERGGGGLRAQVADLMTRNTILCSVDDTLDHVRELMDAHHVRHLPVMDDNQLVGMLSIRDIIAHDVRRAREAPTPRAAAALSA